MEACNRRRISPMKNMLRKARGIHGNILSGLIARHVKTEASRNRFEDRRWSHGVYPKEG